MKESSFATIGFGVCVKPSQISHAGNGLFAKQFFAKNALVTEFEGKHIYSQSKVNELVATHVRTVSFGYHYIDGNVPIQLGKGGAAFANDATQLTDFKNNTTFKKIWDRKQARYRIFLKATKDIQTNEEIFVSYGKDYWHKFF